MANNDINALLRKALNAADQSRKDNRALSAEVRALKASMNTLQQAYRGSAMKALTNRERALAAAVDMRPNYLVIEHDVDDGVTAADNTEQQVDTVGRFIVDRIRCAWRASSGNNSGYFGHGSSGQNPDLTSTNVVDFSFELVDGRNNIYLQNAKLPGDLLFRSDGDGFAPGGLILEGGTNLKVIVTPHRAWPSDGYLIFVFEGIQVYDQVGAPS